jgi:hypothetical protein
VKKLGAIPRPDGTSFRVWAPHVSTVDVRRAGESHALRRAEDGTFEGDLRARRDPETFFRSKLSRRERPGVRDHYRRLLALRHRLPPEVRVERTDQC